MVLANRIVQVRHHILSVLALSSRFDGRIGLRTLSMCFSLSVLALSSRFDGLATPPTRGNTPCAFSTRSVESF